MLLECLINVFQRNTSMENYKWENAPIVARRSDTRTLSKSPKKSSTYKQSRGNRLHRIEQSGEASYEYKQFGEYEAKRFSEAEKNRAQRKARAKASPKQLSSSDISCSICNRQFRAKKVREKSRECHNHKPQPFPDPKRKRKPINLNKHKPNKRTKSTKISSIFPTRGNRNTKRTEKHKNKMTHGKTYNKSPRRINHKATKSKTNTGNTALERSVEQTTGGLKHFTAS